MPFALSICVLIISPTQSVNGAQFLNITFLFKLFVTAATAEVSATVIILFTSMYAPL